MSKQIQPEAIWQEYQKGMQFNQNMQLYDTVKKNENFYLGKQWEGLNAPDLEQPVLNILGRVVTYFIAMLVSDDVGVSINSFSGAPQKGMDSMTGNHGLFPGQFSSFPNSIGQSAAMPGLPNGMGQMAAENSGLMPITPYSLGSMSQQAEQPDMDKLLAQEIERVIERSRAKAYNRDAIRNAAVDGDCCFFLRFDPDISTGQAAQGEIVIDLVDNTNIIFGNPYVNQVQEQPYLIIVKRAKLATVKRQAKKEGVKDWEQITADSDGNYYGEEKQACGTDLVTVLIKLWKDDEGLIHFSKSTQNVVLKEDTLLGYKLYPVAYMNWQKVKNCYHGMAAITPGVIQNQIYINTLWALFMIHVKQMAFPKLFYDQAKIKQWTNKVGQAIKVTGDPNTAVASGWRAPDFSAQAMELVEKTINYTKEFMGASDAALGNIKPDNTSAIIAVQKASSAPLELQRLAFYQFVEDYVRIILDMIRVDYGLRQVRYKDSREQDAVSWVDFSALPYDAMDLNVDVGSSAYWSEITQLQTSDNLFSKGIIQDAVIYLESIPDRYIKNKQAIIDKLRENQMLQQQVSLQQVPGQTPVSKPINEMI